MFVSEIIPSLHIDRRYLFGLKFQKMPGWWVWYYWICPMAWTIYGLITSQFGEDETTIKVPGVEPDPTVKWYLEHRLGYHYDFMGVVAAVLIAFPVVFALLFALCIKKLNFQVR